MNIVIADDHKIVLDGLGLLLSTFDFVREVSIASDAAFLMNVLEQRKADIILLDISFGNADGRELCRKIKRIYPEVRVIALTSHDDGATVNSSLLAGFDGYLLKSEDRATVMRALQLVFEGEQFISPQVKDLTVQRGLTTHKVALTSRELEILQQIVDEKTIKEIAAALFISEKTVEHHRANLILKLDVKNMAGLVRKAVILGYV